MVLYEGCKILGPYDRPDYRRVVEIYWPDKKRVVKHYHRYLMELSIGRYLTEQELVHHKDGNCANNELSNLELVSSQTDHMKLHITRDLTPIFKCCSLCKKEFLLEGKKLISFLNNQKQRDQQNVFCCPVHARKYASNKRWGNI